MLVIRRLHAWLAVIAALGALVHASCSEPRALPPIPPSAPEPEAAMPDASAPDAAAPDASDGCPAVIEPIGGPWVIFHAPPYTGDSGPSEGPSWYFEAPGLPAISSDGKRVLEWDIDGSLGAPPNMDVIEMRVDGASVVTKTPLLDAAAFRRARGGEGAGLDEQRRAYDELRAKVAAHVEAVNARITAEGYRALDACDLDVGAHEVQPACSMKRQHVRCPGGVRFTYREPVLDVAVGSRRTSARRPRWISPPVIGPGDSKTPVRGCLGGAWIDVARGLGVMRVEHACQNAGGDWCDAPTGWHVERLPVRPTPEPPRAAGSGECPRDMIGIPAGTFTMGTPNGRSSEPTHAVHVDAFCIDTTEVTVAAYRACVLAGACFAPDVAAMQGPGSWGSSITYPTECTWGVPGRDRHPINCLPWSFARDYCAWSGKRLPTDEEWEYAARGPESRKYPFGDAIPSQGICWNQRSHGVCPVGAGAADKSPFGVLDMAGSVEEWTATRESDREACFRTPGIVTRGTSWAGDGADELRAARRSSAGPRDRSSTLGFRCARSR